MPQTTQWIDVPGGRLNVVMEGDGPPILLVHAGIADLRAWDAMTPRLVDAGHRVIRYDCRGYGASPTEDVEYSNRADLRAVLDGAGVDRALLVGNSRGAMICLDTILESPERAAGLVWVGGGIGGFDGEPTRAEIEAFDRAEAAETAGDVETQLRLEVEIWVDGIGQPPNRVPAPIRDAARDMNRPLLDPARVAGRPLPLDGVANDRLGEIAVPVLAVVGALDTSYAQRAAARLEEAVAGARRVVIPAVAHMVGMEAPDELARLIVDFARPLGTWA